MHLLYLIAGIYAVLGLLVVWNARRAPCGHEDADGFHEDPPPKP